MGEDHKKEIQSVEDDKQPSQTEESNKEPVTSQDDKQDTITLTQDQLDKMIQKRIDRERKKAEEERQREKMSDAEKYEDLKRQIAERDALERTRQALHDKGLSSSFATFLTNVNEEVANDNIESFSEAFNTAVDKRVQELMKDKTPLKPKTEEKAQKSDDFLGGLNRYF